MANILGYLDWRGDVPLSAVPYNDADELVLCRVAYLPFEGVLPERFAARGLPLTEAIWIHCSDSLAIRFRTPRESPRILNSSP